MHTVDQMKQVRVKLGRRKGATRTLINDTKPSLEDVNPYAYAIDRELPTYIEYFNFYEYKKYD